jgi:hypothetical protein
MHARALRVILCLVLLWPSAATGGAYLYHLPALVVQVAPGDLLPQSDGQGLCGRRIAHRRQAGRAGAPV